MRVLPLLFGFGALVVAVLLARTLLSGPAALSPPRRSHLSRR